MDDFSKSFEETISKTRLEKVESGLDNLNAIMSDFSESAVDDLLANGILKEIPIVKALFLVPKVVSGISNYLLVRKIIKFLTQLETISIEKRKKFVDDLEGKNREEIIGNLLLILDKHENFEKSTLQGKIFKALIERAITQSDYLTLTHAINLLNLQTLNDLTDFYRTGTPLDSTERYYSFVFLELISIDTSTLGSYDSDGIKYEKNVLGEKFVEIIAK